MDKLIFILSTGRTGTKFLAEYFNANFPSIAACHEPKPSYHLRIAANAYVAGAAGTGMLKGLLKSSRGGKLSGSGTYLESNPWLWGFFDVLTTLEPQPHIFHVIRDPRTYVRSTIRHGNLQGVKQAANTMVPFWYVPVEQVLGGQPATEIGRFAAKWRLVNEYLWERGVKYPRYHKLYFEDLFDGRETALKQMCADLGLEYPGTKAHVTTEDRINRGKLKDIGHWSTWTPEQCAELDRICSPLMQDFGYGVEGDWQEKVQSGASHI